MKVIKRLALELVTKPVTISLSLMMTGAGGFLGYMAWGFYGLPLALFWPAVMFEIWLCSDQPGGYGLFNKIEKWAVEK